MSRISKELATNIATKLTEKSEANILLMRKEYSSLVTELYLAQTPKEVLSLYAIQPDWFYTRGFIDFSGHGFRWEQIRSDIPVICNKGTNAELTLNSKISDRLMKIKRAIDAAVDERKKLFSETEQALIACRTYKQIEENIPAAKPYLPPPTSNALMVNFNSLNKKINSQPEIKK